MNDRPSEMFAVALTAKQILDQIEAMRLLAARMSFGSDIVPSRSSARRLAEDLILEYNNREAESRINRNPIGTVSFLWLARKWSHLLSSDGHELVSGRKPDERPFGELSSWLLTCLNVHEKGWSQDCVSDDSYGFSGWPRK